MLLPINEVKPGMKLEQAVISQETGQCLLKAGIILSIRNIEKIKEQRVKQLHIADRYTVFISPEDKIAESLVTDFISVLRTICPYRPEANMNDYVVAVAKDLEAMIVKISKITNIMPFLVEMKLIDNEKLYMHSIYTAVLSGVVASCMEMPHEEVIATVIGALLHNIGMCEMPALIGKDDLTGQQKELYNEHPTYGYYFAIQKNIPRNIAESIQYHHEKGMARVILRELRVRKFLFHQE